jgi:hypothetical protein
MSRYIIKIYLKKERSGVNHNLRENLCKPHQKNHINSQNTHIDDMMIHNLVKYLV